MHSALAPTGTITSVDLSTLFPIISPPISVFLYTARRHLRIYISALEEDN
jgi:hypothetical protein